MQPCKGSAGSGGLHSFCSSPSPSPSRPGAQAASVTHLAAEEWAGSISGKFKMEPRGPLGLQYLPLGGEGGAGCSYQHVTINKWFSV